MGRRMRSMWRTFGPAILTLCLGCGGSSTPAAPTPNSPPPTNNGWSLRGQVIVMNTRQPVSGASVEAGTATAITDAAGQFALTSSTAPTGAFAAVVSAPGYLTRETSIAWPRTTADPVTIDLISTAAPFDLTFYRQFARDAFMRPADLQPLWHWTDAPRLYLKTTDETGLAIEPELLSTVESTLLDAVRVFSANTLTATVERGADPRPEQVGWINVEIRRDRHPQNYCGFNSNIGGNPTTISLYADRCTCRSVTVPSRLIYHEIGHAVGGFFHVRAPEHLMHASTAGSCDPPTISALEQYHAAVAFQRPRRNSDPDKDPSDFALLVDPEAARGSGGGSIGCGREWRE